MLNFIDKVKSGPWEYGCSATFVKIDKTWGFKYFICPWTAAEVRERQLEFFAHSLAPVVDSIILEFETNPGWSYLETRYGYVTELAEVWAERHDLPAECVQEHDEYWDMQQKIEDANLSLHDLHGNNIGYLPNGVLVPIDFGND